VKDEEKTKDQLLTELAACRRRLSGLEQSEEEMKEVQEALEERVKELTCLYAVQQDVTRAESKPEFCQRVIEQIIPAMQFPEITVPVIEIDGRCWSAAGDSQNLSHGLQTEIRADGDVRGELRVYYTKDRPFLVPEEENLIDAVAESIGLWLARQGTRRDLERTNRALRAVSACNQAVIHAEDEGRLLAEICQVLVNDAGYRMAWVGAAQDDEPKRVIPVASAGNEAGYLDEVDVTWADGERGRGPTGTAIRSGEYAACQDLEKEPGYAPWRQAAAERGYGSSVALPLRVDAEVWGALNIYAPEPHAFHADEIELLEELADDLAFGLGALRARAEQERLERAVREVQERYATIAHHLPNGIVQAFDRDLRFTFNAGELLAELGFSAQELLGKTLDQVLPQETADRVASQYREVLAGESVSFEETYASRIFLVNAEPLFGQDGEVKEILSLAVDVTKRKRAEALAREAPVLRGVNRIFREALRGETEEELAKTSLAIAEALTESEFGFICEMNQRGRLNTIAISDPGWEACTVEDSDQVVMAQGLPIRGIRGRVIQEGRAFRFNDPSLRPEWIEPPEGHPEVTAFMGVPLEDARGRTSGLIGLANKEGGYDETDQEAVEALSVAIVQALERKRLQATLARQAEEILEISTPTMEVWEGIVVSPLIGTLDSDRTQRFMEDLLQAVVDTGSEIALVDITGVPTIDTLTAQHLIETVEAVRLLGAKVILTGVRPSIAQTLVHLGIDLSDVITRSSLAAGLRVAFDRFGIRMVTDD